MKIYNSSKSTFYTHFGAIKPGVNIISTNGLISSALKKLDRVLEMYKDYLTTDKAQEQEANILVAPSELVKVDLSNAIDKAADANAASSENTSEANETASKNSKDERAELFSQAKELGLKVPFNIGTEKLKNLVEEASAKK
jgi:hypothetical protein